MILTTNQILEILNIIKKNNLIYLVGSVGLECLNKEDIEFLSDQGIDIEAIKGDFTPFEQAFYFGRLCSLIKDENAKKLKYEDMLAYLRKGQYNPLSSTEKTMLNLAKQKTYNHITWLTTQQQMDVSGVINEQNKKLLEKQKLIRDEIALGVEQRKAYRTISNDIQKKMNDWTMNMDRIVETEYNNVFQEGRAAEFEKKYGSDVKVYKEVYPGACRHCIEKYLTNGIGSKPILFSLQEIKANGSNIGRKVGEWRGVLESMHPHCRCLLVDVPADSYWDEKTKSFEPLKIERKESERKRKGKMIITIGNKRIEV